MHAVLVLLLLAAASSALAACSLADVKGAWSLQMEGEMPGKIKGHKGVSQLTSRFLGRFVLDGKGGVTAVSVRIIQLNGGNKFSMALDTYTASNGSYSVDASLCQYTVSWGSGNQVVGILDAAKADMDAFYSGVLMSGRFERMPSVACTQSSIAGRKTFESSFLVQPGADNRMVKHAYIGQETFAVVNGLGTCTGYEIVTPDVHVIAFNSTYNVSSTCEMQDSFGYHHNLLASGGAWYISMRDDNFDFGPLDV